MSLDQLSDFVKHQTVTQDAFLGGRLTLSQPKGGFRAGMDSVLLGAAIPQGTNKLLDLGAGVGAASLVALSMQRTAQADLLEREVTTAKLAMHNLVANALAGRGRVVITDVNAKPAERRAAGLLENAYDVVISNPPFFTAERGTLAPDSARAGARHMAKNELDNWVRCAAGSARANGSLIVIYPARGLGELLMAIESRFGGLVILPLSSRPGADASRILVRGTKGSRAQMRLLSTRSMHGETGNGFAPEFDAIFRGQAVLDW